MTVSDKISLLISVIECCDHCEFETGLGNTVLAMGKIERSPCNLKNHVSGYTSWLPADPPCDSVGKYSPLDLISGGLLPLLAHF